MENDKCPDCGSSVTYSGNVNCLCDKDFCFGQRCGANELFRKYTCTNDDCNKTGMPEDTANYIETYCNN